MKSKYRLVQIGEWLYAIEEWHWWWPFWCVESFHHDYVDATLALGRLRKPYKPKVLDE